MVWRVPGLTQLNQTYALDVLGQFWGMVARRVRDLQEERGLVSHISVSNMTQRLQGIFIFQLSCQWKICRVEAAIAQHIHYPDRTGYRGRACPCADASCEPVCFGNETPSERAGLYGYYQSMVGDLEPTFNYPTQFEPWIPLTSSGCSAVSISRRLRYCCAQTS